MKVCNTKIQKEACKWSSTSIVRDLLALCLKIKLTVVGHSYTCIECELDNPKIGSFDGSSGSYLQTKLFGCDPDSK